MSDAEITEPIDAARTSPWLTDARLWPIVGPAFGEALNGVVQPVMTPIAGALSGLISSGWVLKAWFWFQIAAGWVLTTIALAGLTGILERDRR